MKERPIIFSGAMVRAILDGRKTQTRRVIKPQPQWIYDQWVWHPNATTILAWQPGVLHPEMVTTCPHGLTSDRLWVRETWTHITKAENEYHTHRLDNGCPVEVIYRADMTDDRHDGHWQSALFMPRWASRLTLEITDVRVQRVQQITNEDAQAEGVSPIAWLGNARLDDYRTPFAQLWDTLNAKRGYSWDANPWVWAIAFRRVPEGG